MRGHIAKGKEDIDTLSSTIPGTLFSPIHFRNLIGQRQVVFENLMSL